MADSYYSMALKKAGEAQAAKPRASGYNATNSSLATRQAVGSANLARYKSGQTINQPGQSDGSFGVMSTAPKFTNHFANLKSYMEGLGDPYAPGGTIEKRARDVMGRSYGNVFDNLQAKYAAQGGGGGDALRQAQNQAEFSRANSLTDLTANLANQSAQFNQQKAQALDSFQALRAQGATQADQAAFDMWVRRSMLPGQLEAQTLSNQGMGLANSGARQTLDFNTSANPYRLQALQLQNLDSTMTLQQKQQSWPLMYQKLKNEVGLSDVQLAQAKDQFDNRGWYGFVSFMSQVAPAAIGVIGTLLTANPLVGAGLAAGTSAAMNAVPKSTPLYPANM